MLRLCCTSRYSSYSRWTIQNTAMLLKCGYFLASRALPGAVHVWRDPDSLDEAAFHQKNVQRKLPRLVSWLLKSVVDCEHVFDQRKVFSPGVWLPFYGAVCSILSAQPPLETTLLVNSFWKPLNSTIRIYIYDHIISHSHIYTFAKCLNRLLFAHKILFQPHLHIHTSTHTPSLQTMFPYVCLSLIVSRRWAIIIISFYEYCLLMVIALTTPNRCQLHSLPALSLIVPVRRPKQHALHLVYRE